MKVSAVSAPLVYLYSSLSLDTLLSNSTQFQFMADLRPLEPMFTDDEDENVTVIASAFPSLAPLSRTVSSVRVTAESADRESCFSRQLPEHKYTLLMDNSSDFTYFHRHILSTQPPTARVRFN